MNQSDLIALKRSYQDMIDLLDRCIQEGSATGMAMGIPKSVDRFSNPDSDKLLPFIGQPTDYSKLMPYINVVINNGTQDPIEEAQETPEERAKELEDYVI